MMRSPAQQLISVVYRSNILAISLQHVELRAVGCEVCAEVFEPFGGFGGFFRIRFLTRESRIGVQGSIERSECCGDLACGFWDRN